MYESVVRSALDRRYDVPVVRVDGDVLRVPDGNAVRHARQALIDDAGLDAEQAAQVVQPIEFDALEWWAVPAAGITLWRHFGQSGDTGEVVTQLADGDPAVQMICEHQGWALIRALDGATGWASDLNWKASATPLPAALVPSWPMRTVHLDREELVEYAHAMVGVPYLWGGTTDTGIDCSGLVQRSAWRASRVWLPRHSTAYLRVGTRVGRHDVQRGDVLVLKRRAESLPPDDGMPIARSGPSGTAMHMAIAVDEQTLVHASRDAWRVVVESRSDVEQRYQVLSVRRIGEGSI